MDLWLGKTSEGGFSIYLLHIILAKLASETSLNQRLILVYRLKLGELPLRQRYKFLSSPCNIHLTKEKKKRRKNI